MNRPGCDVSAAGLPYPHHLVDAILACCIYGKKAERDEREVSPTMTHPFCIAVEIFQHNCRRVEDQRKSLWFNVCWCNAVQWGVSCGSRWAIGKPGSAFLLGSTVGAFHIAKVSERLARHQ